MVASTVTLVPQVATQVCGVNDENLTALEKLTGCDIFARGAKLRLTGPGPKVRHAKGVLGELESAARRRQAVTPDTVAQAAGMLAGSGEGATGGVAEQVIAGKAGKEIRPKTQGQREYLRAIDEATIVLGIGPAGTGKTYLAMAKAVQALKNREVSRIVLTRPAVEAGEKLGFLPGTLDEKIDPYLRPLFDALHDMLEPSAIPKLVDSGVIEVAPLAYMRGRTLSDAFIILDEAQNTTVEQMKMFLTRLGFGSTMVVTGDDTQVDLPGGRRSGLADAREVLAGVEGVHIAELGSGDVVRHGLVSRIVAAYDERAARDGGEAEPAAGGRYRWSRGKGAKEER